MLLLWASCAATHAFAATVHLAPDGNDLRDGADAGSAVATLPRAVALAQASGEAAVVIVAPGTYRGQTLHLDATNFRIPLAIRGASQDPQAYPAFIGDGASTFLRWRGQTQGSPRLSVRNLRIARYGTAISIEGNRDRSDAANGGATIADNIFAQIGTSAKDAPSASTAALRLVNSRDSLIARNYFHGIRNADPRRCAQLHPVYVAHFSSGNRIVGNTFEDYCGSAIKLRDRANANTIAGNRFTRSANSPAIEEWYCDRTARKDCTKAAGECPSTGNIIGDNRFTDTPFFRRLLLRGGRSKRAWCSTEDFATPRVKMDPRLPTAPLLAELAD